MMTIISLIIAFSMTILLIHKLKPLAVRIGFVDQPDDRKHHQGNIPLIGGIAIFCGFMLTLLITDQQLLNLRTLVACAAILMFVGVLDDFHDLPHTARFLVQIFVGLLMMSNAEIALHEFGALTWTSEIIELDFWTTGIFTILAIVMAINAMNMSDGIDGLAGSLTIITLSALSFIAWMAGLEAVWKILLILIMTILAFLIFNLRYPGQAHAQVFMGDAGSMFLGFIIVWFLISLSQGEQRAMTPVTALWIFALPLLDVARLTIHRSLKGTSPFSPDREHLHHLLLKAGFTIQQTLLIIVSVALGLAVCGLLGLFWGMSEFIMFIAFIGIFVCFLLSVRYLL
ncbi:MAG: hypothetical protein KAH77_10900 [Thiomargarita sp.]|nr:hypothetical protein [Thiomargarita sp.]